MADPQAPASCFARCNAYDINAQTHTRAHPFSCGVQATNALTRALLVLTSGVKTVLAAGAGNHYVFHLPDDTQVQSKGAAIEWVRKNKEWQRSVEKGGQSTRIPEDLG